MFSDGHKSSNRNRVSSALTLKPWTSGNPLLVSLLVILWKICLLFSLKTPEKSRTLRGAGYKETSLCFNGAGGGLVMPWPEL